MTRSTVSLLRDDPELGSGLPPVEFAIAQDALVAPSITVEPGPWDWTEAIVPDGESNATMLVLDGLLLSELVLAGHPSAELIGPGDVLPAARHRDTETLLPVEVELTVLEPTRIALLDERVQLACARWPAVGVALLERMEQRAWRLAKQAAICQLPAVHSRLLALFWHLADRWGKVTPDHLVLPLRILHRTLGKMVGAERSTVSLALRQLSDAGLVTRRDDGAWLLSGDACEGLELLTRWGGRPASFVGGESHGDGRSRVRFQR